MRSRRDAHPQGQGHPIVINSFSQSSMKNSSLRVKNSPPVRVSSRKQGKMGFRSGNGGADLQRLLPDLEVGPARQFRKKWSVPEIRDATLVPLSE